MQEKEFISVNVISSVLKEEVENKILGDDQGDKKDLNGNTLSFYQDLGITPPKELLEDDYEALIMDDNSYTEEIAEARLRPNQISFMVNNKDKGCTIYMETDYKISVIETVEEVEEKIKQAKNGI